MLKNKKVFFCLIVQLFLVKTGFTDNSIEMLVKFNVSSSKLLTHASLGNTSMSCSGMTSTNYPYGYSITGSYLDSNNLEIGVDGPFPDDKRKTCKLDDQATGNTNDVYFAVESLPIFFIYDGVQHSCYINQKVGTSWNDANRKNNKLQAENTGMSIACNGLVSTDTYQINHGTGDDKGNITINVADTASSITVIFYTPSRPAVESYSLGESYSMACAGLDNAYHITGTQQGKHQYNDTELSELKINVYGPFNGDPRNTCQIYDQSTGNTNHVYFAVESLPIFFTYDGVQHSCYINQKVGTSFNHSPYIINFGLHKLYSYLKLQGENTAVNIPCNGLVDGDTYQITAGYSSPWFTHTGGIWITPK